ncbi:MULTISPECIES: type II toxin-antitoxin system MqsR family toxin [unclassified Pseudomonas]|uniref:type II toxin-antitoxin system MqsR family toxin n=1 Tax=unclassified Pseudomonas TaxID=196821 RepID=UPI0019129C86|nr:MULTISPECIES: type II toxin-antitoxin system MqsR family toxin [unclassified Pseudomonas]MBK5550583.1 type II toxin-antitoxin system MqsR family toxin [Pseudomonas sp. TH03]MEB0226360.1 type II toxin-antitoxin system MqsR family toxin [Pseudomonas sp. 5S1]MEB0295416.1 type II toxin-antitoxin system MqsR family toxin [Pseudomonas sp. 10S4]WPX20877.1 type II toxin-antitoxin system MqsR family toxin [Pseudomonas sp. 10S4]
MEKNTPHYDLSVVKAQAIRLGTRAFTGTAREGGRRMDLSLSQMLRIVYSLEYRMLHKSMTTCADHRIWQDVYHIKTHGLEIRIKVTYRPGGGPPIISFKEKDA